MTADPAPSQVPPAEVAPAPTACDPLTPRTKPLEITVQPDSGAQPFVDVVNLAKKDLRVMVYEMGFGPIFDAILAQAKAGVKTRVILDLSQKDVNQKYMDQLIAGGAEVIWSDTQFTYMHAKVIIADDATALVSTGNYYIKNLLQERNYAAKDTDPADVKVLTSLFDADFERKSPDLTCTRMLVSPVNAKQRLLDFIASAKKELLVHSMQFAEKDVREAVVARKNAGVAVRAILADPSWIDTNTEAAQFLKTNGIEARYAPHVHVKAVVVDGTTAYVGSENISWTLLAKNREVGLLVTEPSNISTIKGTFEKDWTTATPF